MPPGQESGPPDQEGQPDTEERLRREEKSQLAAAGLGEYSHLPYAVRASGAIDGTVTFSGAKPWLPRLERSLAFGCSGQDVPDPSFVVNDGRLANVAVWLLVLDFGSGRYRAALNARDCLFEPRVQFVEPVDWWTLTSADATLHIPRTAVDGGVGFEVPLYPYASPQKVMTRVKPGTVIPISCGNHPWMKAYAIVAGSPFGAVTGRDGQFAFSGIPIGAYTIAAWHERYGKKLKDVTVRAETTTRINFSFSEADRG